jgi:hypothetical protein
MDGHVPRGFCGATGAPEEVRLVLVCAEPGDPHHGENHLADGRAEEQLASAYKYAARCVETGKDQFHRNLRLVMDMCWPSLSFDQQMRRTWITDSVLCSATKEGAQVARDVELACGRRFLRPQLDLFPSAMVGALGGKAAGRLERLGLRRFHRAHSVAPPGCNYPAARGTWLKLAEELHKQLAEDESKDETKTPDEPEY